MAREPREILEDAAKSQGLKASPGYGPGLRNVSIKVSTKSTEEDPERPGKKKMIPGDFECPLPSDLDTAVKVLGEKVVHRYFINALVVDLQATERNKLAPSEKTGRKKASYLEEIGL